MEPQKANRRLTTLFSTDVQGYSRLMGDDEAATVRTLTAYRKIISSHIEKNGGRVIDSPGDNLLAEFRSVVHAVECAVKIQQELKKRNEEFPENRRMRFRIGINLGDVIVEGDRLYGDGVNIAARLEGLAEGEGICISGDVHRQVESKLPLRFVDLGDKKVKNIAKPVRAYRVLVEPDTADSKASSKAAGQRRRQWATAAVLTTVIIGGPAAWHFYLRPQRIEPASTERMKFPLPEKPSIAVLPFTNLSGDKEQEYFVDGMTDDLITDLSKISGLFVISRNSTFTYKGKAVKVQRVAKELGVRYVLEGSVRRDGGKVRINTQLIDTKTGGHLWAERYDRKLDNIFSLQDEVTQKIAGALAVKLTADEQKRLVRKYTDNLEAYDYYMRGLEYFGRLTKEANILARQMHQRAIDLDPKFAAAYAFLGFTYSQEWTMGWSQDPQSLERAFDLAQKAIALDESLPLGHAMLGEVYLWKKKHEKAIVEQEKAIALSPNDADQIAGLGGIQTWAGRPEETIGLVKKAMRLNPMYPIEYLWNLGHAYFLMGRYEEAIETLMRISDRNPDYLPAHAYLTASYSELGREEKARAEAAEFARLSPNTSLQAWRHRLPYKDQAVMERLYSSLRKAGLPE